MKKPTVQYVVLAILLLWALTAQLTYSGFVIYVQANSTKYPPVPFKTYEYTTTISALRRGYEKSGLRVGDTVVALNVQPLQGEKQLSEIRFRLHPGDTLVVTVQRNVNGRQETLDVPVRMLTYVSDALDWANVIGLSTFLPLSCLLVGFYVAFARPRDPLAWITMAMLTSFGQLPESGYLWGLSSPWREILLVYHPIAGNSGPLWLVLFGLYFPMPFEFIRKHRWPNWVLAVPPIFATALDLYGEFMEGTHIRELAWLAALLKRIGVPLTILYSGYIFAFFYSLGAKIRMMKAPDARRRLHVMITGCEVALVPVLFVVLSDLGVIPRLPAWAASICLLMMIFFPITMAYVIVVQRAMDVRMVIRTGVRYTLASTGLKIIRIVLLAGTVVLTVHFAIQAGHPGEGALIAIAGTVLIIAVRRLSVEAGQWMDRRFFREAYNTEVILTELGNSVATIRDTKALLETVTHRISDSLHVPRIAVLLEQGDAYAPAYAVGFNGGPASIELKRNATTIRILKEMRSPSKVYFDDPQSWVYATPEKEQIALQKLDAQVLLPLTQESRMLGVMSLGPKRSEAPYSKGDLQLLSAVASQTGLALENARLTESIKQEIAQRERLNRELEIAREVQQRLFPQDVPRLAGVDFAGYCRPAFGVGGDYYDFIHLSDGCIGIAIGDVSGKGIAAALMMASLQASLRGQTIKPCETLSEMIQHVNRLVYEASAENRYATFFYAQYDPARRALRYVNAGHNPPVLCRRGNGRQILRLDRGGTVVGLFPDFPYEEAQLALESGDVLVAFTDGISEAMNNAEEEWSEENLIEAIQACDSRSAADVIPYILERVDGFTAGARQHDDMTLVVMRVQ